MKFESAGGRAFLVDYVDYPDFGAWWDSMESDQQIQAGMLGATAKAKRHFGIDERTDTGHRPKGYTPVEEVKEPEPAPAKPNPGSDQFWAQHDSIAAGVKLELTDQEVEAIIKVLGQLPSSSGAYPLMVKIGQQVQQQKS